MTNWREFFSWHITRPLAVFESIDEVAIMENVYQNFKSRLLEELDVEPRMTEEERAEWKDKMVRK